MSATPYTLEQARQEAAEYSHLSFDEQFVEIEGDWYNREEVLTCDMCKTHYFDHAELDEDGYCQENGCSEEYQDNIQAEWDHQRQEAVWSV